MMPGLTSLGIAPSFKNPMKKVPNFVGIWHFSGTPNWIRTSGLSLRRTINLVFCGALT